MTLNTTGIRRCGERLYLRLSAEKFLNADSCADAYEMFVERMRRYRERHPETERVTPAFVKKCERWVRTDLLRRKRRALASLGQVSYRPAPGVLAEIAGVSLKQIRHSLRLCEQEIKAYFG